MGLIDPLDIARLKDSRRRRFSSYDTRGGNFDFVSLKPGETFTIAEIDSPGIITHIWMTVNHPDYYWARRMVLRFYWDGGESPSVEAPVGDFFGVGHGLVSHYQSLMLNMVTNREELPNMAGMNCFFPMPFRRTARLTVTNESPLSCPSLYYYVDYEEVKEIPDDVGYFHARYRQEYPTRGRDGTRLLG